MADPQFLKGMGDAQERGGVPSPPPRYNKTSPIYIGACIINRLAVNLAALYSLTSSVVTLHDVMTLHDALGHYACIGYIYKAVTFLLFEICC